MFCENCGTVLDAENQCVNCNKKESEVEESPGTQVPVSSKAIGR